MNEANSVLNTELDKFHMKEAIAGFSEQISTSFSIMNDWRSKHKYLDIQNIIFK